MTTLPREDARTIDRAVSAIERFGKESAVTIVAGIVAGTAAFYEIPLEEFFQACRDATGWKSTRRRAKR